MPKKKITNKMFENAVVRALGVYIACLERGVEPPKAPATWVWYSMALSCGRGEELYDPLMAFVEAGVSKLEAKEKS